MRMVDALMSAGLAAWQQGRGTSLDIDTLFDRTCETLQRSLGDVTMSDIERSISAELWCHDGFPLIDIESSRYAAALALSDVHSDTKLPWDTFVVRVPPDVLNDVSVLLISRRKKYNKVVFIALSTNAGHAEYGVVSVSTLEDAIAGSNGALSPSEVDPSEFPVHVRDSRDQVQYDHRVVRVALRIALNAACELTNGGRREERKVSSGGRVEKSSPPSTRRFVLGRRVESDFRESVRAFIANKSSELRKIHWIVRGHWVRQPFGPARTNRRLQWREPHWAKRRGAPDDSPVNLREHGLNAKEGSS